MSFYATLREFGALTRRRANAPLEDADELRFGALLSFFETVTGDEEPPARPAPIALAPAVVADAPLVPDAPVFAAALVPDAPAPIAEPVAEAAAAPVDTVMLAPEFTAPTVLVPDAPVLSAAPSEAELSVDVELTPGPQPSGILALSAPVLAAEPIGSTEPAFPKLVLPPAPLEVGPEAREATPPAASLLSAPVEIPVAEAASSIDIDVDESVEVPAVLVPPAPVALSEPTPGPSASWLQAPAESEHVVVSDEIEIATEPAEEEDASVEVTVDEPEEIAQVVEVAPEIVAEAAPAEVAEAAPEPPAIAAAPVEEVVAEAAPIEVAPVLEAAPIEVAPVAEAAPIEVESVAEAAPIEVAPVAEAAPIEVAPVAEAAPIEVAPALEAAPIEEPVEAASLYLSPIGETPAEGSSLLTAIDEPPAELPLAVAVAPNEAITQQEIPVLRFAAKEPEAEPIPEHAHTEGETVRLDASEVAKLVARAAAEKAHLEIVDEPPVAELAPIALEPVPPAPEPIAAELPVLEAVAGEPPDAEVAVAELAPEQDMQSTMIRPALTLPPIAAYAPPAPAPAIVETEDDSELLAFATGEVAEPGFQAQIASQLPSGNASAEWASAPAPAPEAWAAEGAPTWSPTPAEPEAAPAWTAPATSDGWSEPPAPASAWAEPAAPAPEPAWAAPEAPAAEWSAGTPPPDWSAPAPADAWAPPVAAPAAAAAPVAAAASWAAPAAPAASEWDAPPPTAAEPASWAEPAAPTPAWGEEAPTPAWTDPQTPAWTEAAAPAWAPPAAQAAPEGAWNDPQPPREEAWAEAQPEILPEAQWAEEAGVELTPADDDEPPQLIATASEFMAEAAAHNGWAPPAEAPGAVTAPTWVATTEPALEPVAAWSNQPSPPSAQEWAKAASAWTSEAAPVVEAELHQPLVITGDHRIVLHTLEGGVKRGVVSDIDLTSETIALANSPGGPAADVVPYARTKALFFMLQPGEKPTVSDGKRVKVTFVDGRQVEGFLGDELGQGFFLLPLDARTNTARVYVLNHAVRSVV